MKFFNQPTITQLNLPNILSVYVKNTQMIPLMKKRFEDHTYFRC